MDLRLSLVEHIAFSVILVQYCPSIVAVPQIGVSKKGIVIFLIFDSLSMVFAMPERSSVLVAIDVVDYSKDEASVEDTHLCRFWRVSHTLPFPSACLKLSLIHFLFEDLPAVEMLESKPKLPNVLGGVGDEHTVAMQHVILPLTDVLDAMTILLLDCFEVEVLSLEIAGNFFELIVKECQIVIKLKVQFF